MLWDSKWYVCPREAVIKVRDWEGKENLCNTKAEVLWESVIQGKSNKDQIYKQSQGFEYAIKYLISMQHFL